MCLQQSSTKLYKGIVILGLEILRHTPSVLIKHPILQHWQGENRTMCVSNYNSFTFVWWYLLALCEDVSWWFHPRLSFYCLCKRNTDINSAVCYSFLVVHTSLQVSHTKQHIAQVMNVITAASVSSQLTASEFTQQSISEGIPPQMAANCMSYARGSRYSQGPTQGLS